MKAISLLGNGDSSRPTPPPRLVGGALAAVLLAATGWLGCRTIPDTGANDLGSANPAAARPLSFPEDHAAHLEDCVESWTFRLHLDGPNGSKFHLWVSFSRYDPKLDPDTFIHFPLASPSRIAVVSLLDETRDRHHSHVFSNFLGFYAEESEARLDLRVEEARIREQEPGGRLDLKLVGETFSATLELTPEIGPIPLGKDGTLVWRPAGRIQGYLVPRIGASGTLAFQNDQTVINVTGQGSWEHLFGPPPGPHLDGWDVITADLGRQRLVHVIRAHFADPDRPPEPEDVVGLLVDGSTGMLYRFDGSNLSVSTSASTAGLFPSSETGRLHLTQFLINSRSGALDLRVTATRSGQEVLLGGVRGQYMGGAYATGFLGKVAVSGDAFIETLRDTPFRGRALTTSR